MLTNSATRLALYLVGHLSRLETRIIVLEWGSVIATLLTAIFATLGSFLLFYERRHRRLESIEHLCTFGSGLFGLIGALLLILFTFQHHRFEHIQAIQVNKEQIQNAQHLLCLQRQLTATAKETSVAMNQLADAKLRLLDIQQQNRIVRQFSVYVEYKFPPMLVDATQTWKYTKQADQFGINVQKITCRGFNIQLSLLSHTLRPADDRLTKYNSHVHSFKYEPLYPRDIIGKDVSVLNTCKSVQVVSLPIESALKNAGDIFPVQIFTLTLEINGRRTFPISVTSNNGGKDLPQDRTVPVIRWPLNLGERVSTQYLRDEQVPIAPEPKH